eukprot:5337197-Amphidinium_carterae.5
MQSVAIADAEHVAQHVVAGPAHRSVPMFLGASLRPRVGLRAGTGLLIGDDDRPFSDRGLSETGDAHVLNNAHELAIWTARCRASRLNWTLSIERMRRRPTQFVEMMTTAR